MMFFSEFDEQMAIERLRKLYAERNRRITDRQIVDHVRRVARHHRVEMGEAYEMVERSMLDNNPNPEDWS